MSDAGEHDGTGLATERARRAIVVVDLVESVRLLQWHEADVIDRWRRFVLQARPVIARRGGRLVKSLGDGLLAEFEHVPTALAAAIDLQRTMPPLNQGRPPDACMWLRIGLHVCEVVLDELDVFGAGVNTAARIAQLAQPGEVWLSTEARDELADGLDAELHDRGDCWVKHLPEPLRVFSAAPLGDAAQGALPPAAALAGIGVAVLPFAARGDAATASVAADLLADQVSACLSRSPHLRVTSRWSAQAVAARHTEPAAAARLLGVDYLLTGTLYLLGDGLRLLAELVEARSGAVVWAGNAAAGLAEVLAAQDGLVPEIVGGVSAFIVERELERTAGAPMPTLDSHRLLMSAVGLIHRNAPRDFTRAEDLLEALIDRHRRAAQPYAWLAHWHAMSVVQGLRTDGERAAAQALDAARRALNADPASSLALTMTGLVQGFLMHDLDAAGRSYERALAFNPNESLAWLYTATLRAWQGRGPEALQAAWRALGLAPHDPTRYYYESLASLAALAAGDPALAREWAGRSLRMHGRHSATHRSLAIAQWQLGEHDAARTTVRAMLELEPGFTAERYLARFPGGRTAMSIDNADILVAAGAPRR